MTNKEFIKEYVLPMAMAIDETILPSSEMRWKDYSRNLTEKIGDTEVDGVVTVFNRRGAVMDVVYHSEAGDDTEGDFFEMRRRSDLGWTEILRVPMSAAVKLYRQFTRGYISWDNYAAMVRFAATV